MPELISKLLPILQVADPDAERRFYELFGLHTTYEGPEYPGFIAVGNSAIEFGLSRGADAPSPAGFTWQLGISNVDRVIAICQANGVAYEVITEQPREDWSYRVIKCSSPCGMEVLLEEQQQ
jgi:hypothetical protein